MKGQVKLSGILQIPMACYSIQPFHRPLPSIQLCVRSTIGVRDRKKNRKPQLRGGTGMETKGHLPPYVLRRSQGFVQRELRGWGISQMTGITGLGLKGRVEFCQAEIHLGSKRGNTNKPGANNREMKKHEKCEVLLGSSFGAHVGGGGLMGDERGKRAWSQKKCCHVGTIL